MTHDPQRSPVPRGVSLLAGAAELHPLVLVEASGALGILLAKRRCPGNRLEKVLYYRSVMGEPYIIFLDAVELLVLDGFNIARETSKGALIHDPSIMPYEITHLSADTQEAFIDHIAGHDTPWVEKTVASLFARTPGFSLSEDGRLLSPPDYGHGLEHFIGHHPFVDPLKARRHD